MPRRVASAAEIGDLNRRARLLAAGRPGVEFVDPWPALATPDDSLRPAFTNDSLHLNGAGYAAWTSVIRPLVEQLA